MPPENVSSTCHAAWTCLTERLARLNLIPYDVGGNGGCFFKYVLHQRYETADLHFQIRLAGIQHLSYHPQLAKLHSFFFSVNRS